MWCTTLAICVQAVQPDAVVVELCRGRSAMLGSEEDGHSSPQRLSEELDGSRSGDEAGSVSQRAADTASTSGAMQLSHVAAESSVGAGVRVDNPAPARGPLVVGAVASEGASTSRGAAAAVPLLSVTGSGTGAGSFLSALQRSAALGGQGALLLRLLLSNLGSSAASTLGVKGGAEFVAARQAAEAIGAQLVLGDRPIEITLQVGATTQMAAGLLADRLPGIHTLHCV